MLGRYHMPGEKSETEMKPEILTSYLEENPSVKELLAQYDKTKDVIEQAKQAAAYYGPLYPFHGYSLNV
jgi:hypothetical protein